MQIPRPLLQERIGGIGHSTALTIPRSHRAAAMAGTFLQSFARQVCELSEPELATYTELSLDLLSIAVASASPVEVRYSRNPAHSLYRVKAYVEHHLGDQMLDAAMVARGTALSIRYINQLLEREHTSLMRYVWMRRLERCRGEILTSPSTGLRLYEIALRWGFNTPAHFSRAFKLQFGCAPREYWQTHRAP
jgi:AraC-like DNA-binding protein